MAELNNLKESDVYGVLLNVYDPELGVNIVDLGLVYDLKIDLENNVDVTITLTSVACPMGDELMEEIKVKLSELPEVGKVMVYLSFEPMWTPELMNEDARWSMGLS